MSKNGQPPRIVALIENNPYPLEGRTRAHAEALQAAGYQMAVICPRGQGQPWRESINGVQVYRFPNPTAGTRAFSYVIEFPLATLMIALLTQWVWLSHGLDVLVASNPPDTLFVASLLPKLAGKTFVYDLRDLSREVYEAKFGSNSSFIVRLLLWLERCSCRAASHVTVVNESYRRIVMERDGMPSERVTVIRQGPDLNHVSLTGPLPELRERAKTIIAFLGHMARQDGIDHLLRALHYLDQRFDHKDWLCTLIGPVEEPQELDELAAELGVADRIWFTGYLPSEEWVPILSTADICVEPCPVNSFNNISTMNKLMDYMALSKPSVAYDMMEHHFTAGEAALYALPNDEADFAHKLAQLIEQPELRTKLGAIGRERVEQHLALKYQRERLLNLYSELTQWGTTHQSG
jgi:glycosyltransferase involved in cell wall biosynthesis